NVRYIQHQAAGKFMLYAEAPVVGGLSLLVLRSAKNILRCEVGLCALQVGEAGVKDRRRKEVRGSGHRPDADARCADIVHRPVASYDDAEAAAKRGPAIAEHIPGEAGTGSKLDRRRFEEVAVVLVNPGEGNPARGIGRRVESSLTDVGERR